MAPIRNTKQATTRAAPFPATKPLSRTDKTIEDIYKSGFVKTELPLPPNALGNLTNEILPIFRHANFLEITSKVYNKVVVPSARLASLLLHHPSLHTMFRTILAHGPLIPLGEDDNAGDPLYRYPANFAPITAGDIALIHVSLRELAEFVTFRSSAKLQTYCGRTNSTEADTRTTLDAQTMHLQGRGSTIFYCPKLLSMLTHATRTFPATQDVPLLLAWRFHFAVLLAHEACHALVFAKDGFMDELDTEPFMPNAVTAEIGFTMEETLFGGHFAFLWETNQLSDAEAQQKHLKAPGTVSDFVGLPVVWDWPCTWIAKDYLKDNCAMWIRQADRAVLSNIDYAFRVPLADLARFFQREFWAAGNPNVRLARKVGFAFRSDKNGVKAPHLLGLATFKNRFPEGYELSEQKAIIKQM
jgi:hypothetical protein